VYFAWPTGKVGIRVLTVTNVIIYIYCDLYITVIRHYWTLCFMTYLFYRQDLPQNGKLPVLNLFRPKINIFAPQGRLVAPIHVKFGKTEGHMGPLSRVKSVPGVGTRPQKWQKFPLFSKESPHRGESFHRFPQLLGAFIRPTILH